MPTIASQCWEEETSNAPLRGRFRAQGQWYPEEPSKDQSVAEGPQAVSLKLRSSQGRPHQQDFLQPDDIAQLLLGVLLLPNSAEVTEVVVRPMRKP